MEKMDQPSAELPEENDEQSKVRKASAAMLSGVALASALGGTYLQHANDVEVAQENQIQKLQMDRQSELRSVFVDNAHLFDVRQQFELSPKKQQEVSALSAELAEEVGRGPDRTEALVANEYSSRGNTGFLRDFVAEMKKSPTPLSLTKAMEFVRDHPFTKSDIQPET